MSRQAIQKALFQVLRQSGQPMTIRELVERVRRQQPEFSHVADFDFRSAVLAMTVGGTIESTSTNTVVVRPADPVPAPRG